MSISATEGISYGVTGAAGASSAAGAADKNMFLELMVTQMRYQDPLNPTDSSQMMAQTAQFTALEKMQAVADQTAMMLSTQLAFGASALIGQTVRWNDADGVEQSGTVQGTTYLATGPVLSVDGREVPMTDVTSVGDAPTIQGSAPTSGSGSWTPPVGLPATEA
jgi:flagellar basal-body rod modification protein FlgD